MRVFILSGYPGAGKTEQGKKLEEAGFQRFCSGDLFRKLSEERPDLKETIEQGIILNGRENDAYLYENLCKFLAENRQADIILDGVPRTSQQAVYVDNILAGYNTDIAALVEIEIDEATSVKRLLPRGRADDTPESIARRHEEYRIKNADVRAHYEQLGKLRVVDGKADVDTVYQRIQAVTREQLPAAQATADMASGP